MDNGPAISSGTKPRHPIRTEHDKFVLDRALRIIVPTIRKIDRFVVPGYEDLGIADKVRAFKEMSKGLAPIGSSIWMTLYMWGMPIHAGKDTGLYGDDPDFPFPSADAACWALQDENIADFLETPDWQDVNPAYVLACVARSVCNQIPAMSLVEAALFAVTGCLPPSRATVLEVHSDKKGTYGYSVHSSITNISKECTRALGQAMRNEPHEKAMRYEVDDFPRAADGARGTSTDTDEIVEIYYEILDELDSDPNRDSSWEARRKEMNRRMQEEKGKTANYFDDELSFKNYMEKTLRTRKERSAKEARWHSMPTDFSESVIELADAAESNDDIILVEQIETGYGRIDADGVERPQSLFGFATNRELWPSHL